MFFFRVDGAAIVRTRWENAIILVMMGWCWRCGRGVLCRAVVGGGRRCRAFGHGRRSSCAKIRPAPTSFTSAGVVTLYDLHAVSFDCIVVSRWRGPLCRRNHCTSVVADTSVIPRTVTTGRVQGLPKYWKTSQ